MSTTLRPLPLMRRYWRYYALGGGALVVTNLCDTTLPLLLKIAIDDIVLARGLLPLWAIAVLYLLLVGFLGLYRYAWRYFFIGASHRIANEIRARLFHHLTRLDAAYYQDQRTGDLMSRLTNDVRAVRMFFAIGLLLTLDTTMYMLIIPPVMIWLAPKLSLYALLPLLVLPLFVYRLGRVVHARFGAVQDRFGDLSAHVEETMGGIRVVKGFTLEEDRLRRFREIADRYVADNMRLQVAQGLFQPVNGLVMATGLAVVIFVGGRMAISGAITVGSFVAFQHYLLKLAWPMRAVGFTVNIYQRGLASLERLNEILRVVPAIDDGPQTDAEAEVREGRVQLSGLTFRYPPVRAGSGDEPAAGDGDGDRASVAPALADVSLEIAAGETVALVGPVGCGKSTFLRMVPRVIEAAPGAVRVDGHDVRTVPLARLRAAIGYVPQETFLFATTVAENIAFGAPDASAEDIRIAAERAGVLRDIEALPQGFGTLLGERGVNLSGGQRQRLAIARAIVRKPRVLLLDDCLSAVDTETEAAILHGLREERKGRTTLIASHRLQAVRDADRIVCLDQGRVVEVGAHDALLAKGRLYARLWERQQLEQTVEAA